MADIFISYTSSDREWAYWVGHQLESLDLLELGGTGSQRNACSSQRGVSHPAFRFAFVTGMSELGCPRLRGQPLRRTFKRLRTLGSSRLWEC
jgi:hypothetical protein